MERTAWTMTVEAVSRTATPRRLQGLGWTDRAIVCPSDLSFDTARHRYIIVPWTTPSCHSRQLAVALASFWVGARGN